MIGAVFILYNGSWHINIGDMMILSATLFYPFGNFYSKRALTMVSPETIVFVRNVVGSALILPLALLIEPNVTYTNIFIDYWWLLAINGIIIYVISKILWYKGLNKLDISKAITIAMTYPIISLFLLVAFIGETISLYQWAGIAIMGIGTYFAVMRKSADIRKTKYGSHLK